MEVVYSVMRLKRKVVAASVVLVCIVQRLRYIAYVVYKHSQCRRPRLFIGIVMASCRIIHVIVSVRSKGFIQLLNCICNISIYYKASCTQEQRSVNLINRIVLVMPSLLKLSAVAFD